MTKAIFVVWGDDLATALRDPGLHERLAAVGVRRLQVNVEDEHVAGAMRIDHLDDPIAGFVTVWDVETGPVADLLRTAATTVHGYGVDERRRLDPPEAWDGSRADALANVAVLRRPDELDQAEWLQRWMVDHTGVGDPDPGDLRLRAEHRAGAADPGAPRIDGIVEELFPSAAVTDIHAFYGSGGDDAELGRRIDVLMASVGPDRRRPADRPGADQPLPLRAGVGPDVDDVRVERDVAGDRRDRVVRRLVGPHRVVVGLRRRRPGCSRTRRPCRGSTSRGRCARARPGRRRSAARTAPPGTSTPAASAPRSCRRPSAPPASRRRGRGWA